MREAPQKLHGNIRAGVNVVSKLSAPTFYFVLIRNVLAGSQAMPKKRPNATNMKVLKKM